MAKLILIAGISRSGKTTLANRLANDLTNAIVLHQDEFIVDQNSLPSINGRIDWEKPETIAWGNLIDAYHKASQQYSFVIIEGIFALSDLQLVNIADFRILLDLDYNQFIKRRNQENRWGDEPSWFIEHVWASHLVFHNPHKLIPDIQLRDISPIEYTNLLNQLKS